MTSRSKTSSEASQFGDSSSDVPDRSRAPAPDRQLIGLVAARQRAAEETLVRRLFGRVTRLSRSLCQDEADADDVTQQALLELLRSASSFRFETSLERWADRITLRCALGAFRRERRRRGLLSRWLAPERLPWGVEAQTSARDFWDLDSVLSRLPYERREALILRHGLGYSIDEISELTGAPRGTVKDRLVAARKQVRRWLSSNLVSAPPSGREAK